MPTAMDRKELQQRLMATFVGELEEHLTALTRDLVQLEKEGDEAARKALLQSLFRTAHSLKGAARSVGAAPVEQACHRIEELLAGAREGKLVLSDDQFQRLFAAADQLQAAGRTLLAEQAAAAPVASAGPTPAAAAAPVAAPAPAAAPATAGPAPAGPVVPGGAAEGFARIPGERLESLLQQTGEVLVARSRFEARGAALRESRELARGCRLERQSAGRAVKALTRHLGAGANGQARLAQTLGSALAGLDENLARLERQLEELEAAFTGDLRRLGGSTTELHDQVRRLRMVPLEELVPFLDRAVRDIARSTGKEAALVTALGGIEVDRPVLQRLKDPLIHLCRNAVDHGIESPSDRAAAGKPAAGTIRLAAEQRGAEVIVSVIDDGRGLDLPAIRAQAQRTGLAPVGSVQDAAAVVFNAGFSTAPVVTELSGRGVGLDVVKTSVEGLHGTVSVASEPGRGSTFTLRVPVTLSTFRAVLFQLSSHVFALPSSAVRRLDRLTPQRIVSIEGREMLVTTTGPVPLGSMAEALGLPGRELGEGQPPVVIVEVGTRAAALVIDVALEERDVLLKPLGPHLRGSPFVLGGTVLPDGHLALVLSAAELLRTFLGRGRAEPLAARLTREQAPVRKRILVADDSITTRSLEKSIIESAGYDVLAAADGEEAWRLLQQGSAVDLVVSDVEMPRMDGFTLAETIRSSRQWNRLPVVLVSALCSDADKARGLAVGANAYIVKGTFDQHELLQTISELL